MKELSFKLSEDISTKPRKLEKFDKLDVDVNVKTEEVSKHNRRWRCELGLELKPHEGIELPYNFRIVLVGFFHISKQYPSDKVELLAKTNCPTILYSTAREMLVTVVRRSPYAPVLIPSVTFLDKPLTTEPAKP